MPTWQDGAVPTDVVQSAPARSRLTGRRRAVGAALAVVGLVGVGQLVLRAPDPPVAPRPVAHVSPVPTPTASRDQGIWLGTWWPVAPELGTAAAAAWRATHETGDSEIGVLYAAHLPGGPEVAILSGVAPMGNQVALLVRRTEGWVRAQTVRAPLILPDVLAFLVPDSESGLVYGPGHVLVLARNATAATITTGHPGRAAVTERTLPLEHGALSAAAPDLSSVTRVAVGSAGRRVADLTPADPAGAPRPPAAPASYILASRSIDDHVEQVRTDGRTTICLTHQYPLPGRYPDTWFCDRLQDRAVEHLSSLGVVYGCGPADATGVMLIRAGHPSVTVRTLHAPTWTRSCYAWFGDETTISTVRWQR